jgi:hypothetical protein
VLSLPFALRFLLATDPDSLTRVLRTVYRAISGFQLRQAGLTRATGFPGAVTLIQRFGSALNLNIHFHMIFLAGVYLPAEGAAPVFRQVPAPTGTELQELVQQIAARIGKVLEQRGLVERDMENAWLAMQAEGGPLDDLIGHSITYRIAVGPRAGQKLFTLQTVPARVPEPEQQSDGRGAANAGGFSLHAGLDIRPHQREKPEPLDLMARLAALVPPPRMHLTRFHGVVAPHSKLRAAVTPAHRGVGGKSDPADSGKPLTACHVAMCWAQRLKRVFGVQIDTCARCGGQLKVIASIEEPEVIAKILAHLEKTAPDQQQAKLPLGARAPPQQARLI